MKKDSRRSIYSPQKAKSFRNAVASLLREQFPRFGGPKVIDLFLDELTQIVDQFFPQTKHLRPGEVVWVGVAKEDRPARGKDMSRTKTRLAVLPLITWSDIVSLEAGVPFREVTRQRMARVLTHADRCGIVLSGADLSLLFSASTGRVCGNIRQYEKEHHLILPRRGSVHDLGRSVSHKLTICRKRFLEAKEPTQIARETYHTIESVDRYCQAFERVRFCHQKGMNAPEIAFSTQMSISLVKEYLDLAKELEDQSQHSRCQMA